MYDQRLFNQTAGLGSGFGHEEDYNLYDKPLFADRTAASIYKNVKNIDVDEYVSEEAPHGEASRVRKVLGSSANNANQAGFDGPRDGQGAAAQDQAGPRGGGRSKPVEFEKTRLATAADDADYQAGLQKR